MKDLLFFICVIFFLSLAAFFAPQKLYIPIKKGTVLEYEIINMSDKTKRYAYQTINKCNDQHVITDYDIVLCNSSHTPVSSPIRSSVPVYNSIINFYAGNLAETNPRTNIKISGKNVSFQDNVNVGQTLSSGYLKISNDTLQIQIHVSDREIKEQKFICLSAGTYYCFKIEETYVIENQGIRTYNKASNWYVPGIGIIKSDIYNQDGKLLYKQNLMSVNTTILNKFPESTQPPAMTSIN